MKSLNKKYVQVGILSLILGFLVLGHYFSSKTESTQMASRMTRLGKTKLSKKTQKELDIKLVDPAMSQMWGIKSVNAQQAWKRLNATGSRDIIVAIIDTGIDVQHPDLQKNLWVNKGEVGFDKNGKNKATNNKDDDGNGCIDDVNGCNLITRKGDLKDNHGHGTHIAGIIGATRGNGVGISGVAPNVSMMILKYYDPKAPGVNNLNNTIYAIEYAIKKGAHIINYSGGGLEPSPREKAAIVKAQKKGILFVAAAGNERSNSDVKGYFPADYKLKNIISVTAIDKSKNVLPTS